jgi:hypothetical protein
LEQPELQVLLQALLPLLPGAVLQVSQPARQPGPV